MLQVGVSQTSLMNPPFKFLLVISVSARAPIDGAMQAPSIGADFSSGPYSVHTCLYGMRLPSLTPTPCPMGRGYTVNEGWITYEAPDGSGVIVIDSVEIDESMYPIVIESRRLATDTLGAGQWTSALATEGSYQSLSRDMTVAYCADGDTHPAKVVLDGLSGAPLRLVCCATSESRGSQVATAATLSSSTS